MSNSSAQATSANPSASQGKGASQADTKPKLLTRIAGRFGVDEMKLLETLKATAFKQRDGTAPTNEQMIALLVVAEQYQLNPFTREIYAFPDKQNGIVPVVGVDGWSRIINTHQNYAGMDFVYSDEMTTMPDAKVPGHVWIECVMYRKDIDRPIRVREYLDEVYREAFKKNGYTVTGPWQTHTKRFHRHKAMIQCARLAFGFSGIYDQDEAERIAEIDITAEGSHTTSVGAKAVSQGASLQLTHQQQQNMAPILDQLVKRAMDAGAWNGAYEWVRGRYAGAELEYAIQSLRDAEIESMPAEVVSTASVVEKQAEQPTSEVMPKAQQASKAKPKSDQPTPDNNVQAAPKQNQAPAESKPEDVFPRPEDQFPDFDEEGPGF
ncbi:phage recombination protein Bet [Modicisalibacter xianhensis]|uniref:Phage recombination protein Bet n=1 Tax=Modicisalibacter xianhensis TaxID=442341 RepID=A0A4R8FKL8_9GAMM|nr:phage recombination protein Bet [Halomonas xianhensis]